MARFLLCWEFGGALGHAGRFKSLAEALLGRGHQVDLMLRDIVHTRALLSDLNAQGARILQAPIWLHQTVGVPNPVISLSEIVMGNGYLQAEALTGLVEGWRGVMSLCQPDVIVADYAPTATLAARTLGIPVASVGIGFYVPPDASPLPPFRTWEPIAAGRVEHYDRQVLATVNEVLCKYQAPPLAKLADLFRGDLPLLCTWPELDHHGRGARPADQHYLGPSLLPSSGEAPQWPEGDGPAVFAYIRSSHPDHLALLQALDQLGCRTLCYLPEVAAGQPEPLRSPRIRYARGPVHLGQALPQSQLVICHAGEATLAQAILAGVPVLMLPMQAEQFLMALRVEEAGVGINVAARTRPTDYKAWLSQLLNQPVHRQAAQGLAQRYQAFSHERQTAELVAAFESLVP